MADLADIRAAIAAALQTVEGIGQASAYMLSSPSPPCAHVFPAEVDYDEAMQGGHVALVLTVQAFASLSSDIGAQKILDPWILTTGGSGLVKEALEADQTLGGKAYATAVESCSGYQVYVQGDGRAFLGCEWRVVVQAAG